MKEKLCLVLMFSILFVFPVKGQIKTSFNGYVSNMQSAMFEKFDEQWTNDNLIHNRLNFKTYIGSNINFSVELRNRFLFGETVKYFPDYDEMIGKDNGWQDLSFNLASGDSYIFNSSLDRVFADITLGNLQTTIGRQRINWGMNFVWNPNDIFNSYSFFDFDYIERPGSDAVRLQYYLNSSSSAEVVAKINQNNEWSFASLVRINALGADFQILAGILDEQEYVIGGGFSRYIGPVSISGEISYLDPKDDNPLKESATIGGFGLGYNTPFNLYIQFEYLYNSAAENAGISSFNDFYYRELSLRDLSFAPHTFFSSLSYPASPLINIGVSGMFFPKLKGLFLGPTIDLSLRNDLDLSFYVQYFEIGSQEIDQKINMGFLRLKWSF